MDLHRPLHLDDFEFQPSVPILKQFLQKEIPNMIFYGPSGSGKKSLLYSFLYDKYGIKIENTKCINKIFKINSKEVEIPYFYSNYHIEIQTSDMANYTRNILPELIKTIGSTRNILHNGCKILILHGAENLDSFTQNMLRRFFETYYKSCRFILITSQLNKIIKPLQSRCLPIRVPAPSIEQINSIVPNKSTHRNMKLVWIEKAFHVMPELPINIFVSNLLKGKKNDPQEFIYSLLVKNYNFMDVIRDMYEIFRKELNEEKLKQIIPVIAKYSRRLCEGSRDIIHMEALILNLNLIL